MPTTVFTPPVPSCRAAVKLLATLAGIVSFGLWICTNFGRWHAGSGAGHFVRSRPISREGCCPCTEFDRPPNRYLEAHGIGALGRSWVVEPPPQYTGQSLPERNRSKHFFPQASAAREICTLGSMSRKRKLFHLEMESPALWRVVAGKGYSRHRRQAHTSSTLRRDPGGPHHLTASSGLGRPTIEPAYVQPNLPAPYMQRSQRVGERSSLQYMLFESPQAVQPPPISLVQETQSAERQSA